MTQTETVWDLPKIITSIVFVSMLLGVGYLVIDAIGNEGVSTSTYTTTDTFTLDMQPDSTNTTTLTTVPINAGTEVLLA